MHMSTVRVEELLIIVFGAPGFLLFAWALAARQFRGSGNGNFGFAEPGDLPRARPAAGATKWRRRVAFAVIMTIFFLVSVCPVVLTLVMVYRGINALKSDHATVARGRAGEFKAHGVVRSR